MPTSMTGSDTWKSLLERALRCLDSLAGLAMAAPEWTFGGGTVLMLRHAHRVSKDVDIFLHDAQFLTALSPRLNSAVLAMTESYLEGSSSLKLSFDQGEIDFIIAPSLLRLPPVVFDFIGRAVLTDRSAEIIAKKLFYRTASLKIRDVIDLATVLEKEETVAEEIRPALSGKAEQIRRRLQQLSNGFGKRVADETVLLPVGQEIAPRALAVALRFVDTL
jgi:hypothetical protein